MNFTIDPAYLTSVSIRKEWSMYAGKETLTDEEMISVLKGTDRCGMTSTQDHPEFEKLREQLGRDEYIKIERGWWNGDVVTKPFILNGVKFKVGEQFSCASALSHTLKVKSKIRAKTKK